MKLSDPLADLGVQNRPPNPRVDRRTNAAPTMGSGVVFGAVDRFSIALASLTALARRLLTAGDFQGAIPFRR